MTRLIGRTDLLEIWCCCKTKLEVLRSEEKTTSEISETNMNIIRNKLQKLFPTGQLIEYDEVADVFVNKDDFLGYVQSNERNKELGKVNVSNTEDNGKRMDNDQNSDILSAIPHKDIITQSVQENADERNVLESRLYEALPDEDLKKVFSRFIELTRSISDNDHEKQKKETNDISTEAVIHYETERNSYQGLTSMCNYSYTLFCLYLSFKRNRKYKKRKTLLKVII